MTENLEARTGEGKGQESEKGRKYTLLAYNLYNQKEIFGGGNPQTEAHKLLFDSIDKAVGYLNANLGYVMHNRIRKVEVIPIETDPFSSRKFGEPVKRLVLKWVEG